MEPAACLQGIHTFYLHSYGNSLQVCFITYRDKENKNGKDLINSTQNGPSREADSFSADQETSCIYGVRKFNIVHTTVRYLSLSQARPIHPKHSHPISYRYKLTLSFQQCLVLPSGLVISRFPTKTLHTIFFPRMRATCIAHLILLDHLNKAACLYTYYSDGEFEKN